MEEMDKDTLNELKLKIIQEQMDFTNYAGQAFLTQDKEMMDFFRGQYFALEKLRKYISQKHLDLLVKENEEEEKKTYAGYVEEQMATLKDHDHKLFVEIVEGLVGEGWLEEGGSQTYRLLYKGDSSIKIFRHAESSQVIKICFSAEPEEEDEKEI